VLKLVNILKRIALFSVLLTSFSCYQGKLDPIDVEIGLTRSEFEKGLVKDKRNSSKKDKKSQSEMTTIPNVSKLIITPPPPQIGGEKTISLSITDQIPLKDVLIELGRTAKIDIDLDPTISGGIVLNAKNRPLKEVIDRIATLGQLRYSYQNGVLHFERDSPYPKNYFVDFLSGSQLWGDVETNIGAMLSNGSSSDSNASTSSSSSTGSSKYSSNKSAGIISIYATRAQHEQISQYLDDVYKVASAQVLIEAKVVEVTLNKEFHTGIDWSWIDNSSRTISTTGTFGESLSTASTPALTGSLTKLRLLPTGSLSASIKALEKFGTARAVSSPRINAINNQKAILDFSEQKIYFTVSASSSTSTGTATNTVSTVTATKNEVDVGVKLDITPSINLVTNEITLDIKPKLSVYSGTDADDPSVNPSTGVSLGNKIPIIRTRELSTIAKVQSGNVLVIGGLMSESAADIDSGLPFLMRIPVLKYLFGYSSKTTSIIETVIFIKATIINNGAAPIKYDRDIYEKYTVDKKPFITN